MDDLDSQLAMKLTTMVTVSVVLIHYRHTSAQTYRHQYAQC